MNAMVATTRLTPLADALNLMLAGVEPVLPVRLGSWEAVGLPAAETVVAPAPVPASAIAQRSGIAVSSTDLVGASVHAPAMLMSAPPAIRAGCPLPAGTDAVLPADAASTAGAFAEIGQAAYPGENATMAGADLAAGATIIRTGQTVTPAVALALYTAGIETIAVRRLRYDCLDPGDDGPGEETPARYWLRQALAAAGARRGDGIGDLLFVFPDDPETLPQVANPTWTCRSGLALRPGAAAGVVEAGRGCPTLITPGRFDSVVAVFHALVLPAIARLSERAIRYETRPLTRRITSQVGFTDIALLRSVESGYEPLSVGQVTLSALIAADAVALIPPESEGAAAGAPIAAISMHDPLGPA
jgi:molybdopterin biosynthesis enzyme